MYSQRNGNSYQNNHTNKNDSGRRSPVRRIVRDRFASSTRNNSETQENSPYRETTTTWKKRKKIEQNCTNDGSNSFIDDYEINSSSSNFEIGGEQDETAATCDDNYYSNHYEVDNNASESVTYNNSFYCNTLAAPTDTDSSVVNCEHIFNEYCRALELFTEVTTFFKTEKQIKLTSYVIEFYNGSFFWDQVIGEYVQSDNQAKEQAYAVGCQKLITKFGFELAHKFGSELLRLRNRQQPLELHWNAWSPFFRPPLPPPSNVPLPPLPPGVVPPPPPSNVPLPPLPPGVVPPPPPSNVPLPPLPPGVVPPPRPNVLLPPFPPPPPSTNCRPGTLFYNKLMVPLPPSGRGLTPVNNNMSEQATSPPYPCVSSPPVLYKRSATD